MQNKINYLTERTRIFTTGESQPEYLIQRGLVELQDAHGDVVGVLRAGDVLDTEYTSYAVSTVILTELLDSDKSHIIKKDITRKRLLKWAQAHAIEDSKKRILSVLTGVGSGAPLSITVQDLARLCRMSRVWTTKLVKELERDGLIHKNGCFEINDLAIKKSWQIQ